MTSRSFIVLIKPDGVRRGLIGKIVERFETKGFEIRAFRMLKPDEFYSTIQKHYEEHKDKVFYKDLIDFSVSGKICVIIFHGNIEVARTLVGSTIPSEARMGTIRGDYSCSLPQNLIHCSDSNESATKEIGIWINLL